jgi:hypothetical protein
VSPEVGETKHAREATGRLVNNTGADAHAKR